MMQIPKPNFYNRKSPRLQGYDYSRAGYYFVTVVTKDREHLFGKISNSKMVLNDLGKIVQEEWLRSFEIRKELFCEDYIIMPNHIHAIIIHVGTSGGRPIIGERPLIEEHSIIEEHSNSKNTNNSENMNNNEIPNDNGKQDLAGIEDVIYRLEDVRRTSLRRRGNNKNYLPKSISSFFAGFKSVVTKRFTEIRQTSGLSVWQSRYHDHIIRDENEFYHIQSYIKKNPENWQDDLERFPPWGRAAARPQFYYTP